MLYAIYAYEGSFGGLHGMNSHVIVECNSMAEAEEVALEESMDMMESYSCIMDDIYEAASEDYEEGTDEWYQAVEDMKRSDAKWEIYYVIDTKGKSANRLEVEFEIDKDKFIKTYCLMKKD